MIRVTEPTHPEFTQWQTEAQSARQRLLDEYVKSGKSPEEWDSALWDSAAQAYLNKIFHDKCAFCEGKGTGYMITPCHFRPIHSFILTGPPPRPHPGYFWLAYEWYNLVPACGDCVKRRAGNEGAGAAAADVFPISGVAVMRPGSNPSLWQRAHGAEAPLLLDPYSPHPFTGDLRFDPKTYHVASSTDRGRRTIEQFDLNREALLVSRAEAWIRFRRAVSLSPTLDEGVEIKSSLAHSSCLKFCLRRYRNAPIGRGPGAVAAVAWHRPGI